MHPESTSAAATLAGWHSALSEISTLGDALCGAIEHDDLMAAIATMMQLRRARTGVERIDVAATTQGVDRDMLREIRESIARSHQVDAVMQQWLTRDLPSDASLLASPLGIAVLADAILTPVWDFERDLLVLIGAEYAPVAHLLVDLGQQRIVFVGTADVPETVCCVTTPKEAMAAIAEMAPVSPRQVAWRSSPDLDETTFEEYRKVVHGTVQDLAVSRNTRVSYGRKWISQAAVNLPVIAQVPTTDDVGQAFTGKPMIIVAPGPSLAKNIDQLRAAKGKAVIACVSHALKPLREAGIVPDLIIALDPDDATYHYAGTDVSQSFLVNAATVIPTLFQMNARGMLSFAGNGVTDGWIYDALGKSPIVPGGGSVTTTAFSLALQWQCNPIVFVGLDLSFSGNQYYIATSVDGDAKVDIREDGTMKVENWSEDFVEMCEKDSPGAPAEELLELAGWGGGRVSTSFSLGMFHRWFEDALSLGVKAEVFNCTEGGAFIKGAVHVPFAEVLAQMTEAFDAGAALDTIMIAAAAGDRASKLGRHIGSVVSRLTRVRQMATHAGVQIKRGASERDLQRTETALVRALEPIPFVGLIAQQEVERALAVAKHEGNASDFLAASALLFRQLVDVCDYLLPVMTGAQANLATARRHGAT